MFAHRTLGLRSCAHLSHAMAARRRVVPTTHVARVNGIRMHFVTYGQGPVSVVLCHGFPELASSGYRVIVPDMRGYGFTEAPESVAAYSMKHITQDMVCLLDHLHIRRAVFVGHDWGGAVVWALAQHHPLRVHAVAGINTPLIPHAPMEPLELMKMKPGRWDYQLYFQEEGVAEKELEADVSRTMNAFVRAAADPVPGAQPGLSTRNVRKRGGILVGLPQHVPRSKLLPEEDLRAYVAAFSRTGFRGPLNWYRNLDVNWRWDEEELVEGKQILCPALMVTAGNDAVLTPEMSEGMEERVPHLTRAHSKHCSHWTQFEEPVWLAHTLLQWLKEAAPLARL